MKHGHLRASKMIALNNQCRMLHERHKTKGLRIDVQITDPYSGEQRWVDTTCIHPTCKTRISSEFKCTIQKLQAQEKARTDNVMDPMDRKQWYAVNAQTSRKHAVYAPLMTVALKQFADGRRSRKPIFLAAVVSSLGELGRESVQLQEFLTAAYGRKLARDGPRDDGQNPKVLTGRFRNKIRTRFIIAVAKGVAMQIWSTGLPASSCRKRIANI